MNCKSFSKHYPEQDVTIDYILEFFEVSKDSPGERITLSGVLSPTKLSFRDKAPEIFDKYPAQVSELKTACDKYVEQFPDLLKDNKPFGLAAKIE